MDAAEVGRPAHQPVKGVDLADQVAFAEAPDGRIARHRANGRNSMGDERRLGSHARGRGGRLAAGMASAHDDDVVCVLIGSNLQAGLLSQAGQASISPTDRGPCFT